MQTRLTQGSLPRAIAGLRGYRYATGDAFQEISGDDYDRGRARGRRALDCRRRGFAGRADLRPVARGGRRAGASPGPAGAGRPARTRRSRAGDGIRLLGHAMSHWPATKAKRVLAALLR